MLMGWMLLCILHSVTHAQTKIFKEISEDIQSQVSSIIQDDNLVGYLVFTQLEKASEDSFNYSITIMDENLNDIGKVDFREEKLFLQSVSFEEDVLCLAYLKSNKLGNTYRNSRQFRKDVGDAKNMIFMQFIGLDGKIRNTQSIKTKIDIEEAMQITGVYAKGGLKYSIQMRNIAGKGFVCFYGDLDQKNLLAYNTKGEQLWHTKVNDDGTGFYLVASGNDAYLLLKKADRFQEGGYELLSYDLSEGKSYPKYVLRDKQGHLLRALKMENDPASGKLFISGNIMKPIRKETANTTKSITKGAFAGVFTINFNGHTKKDIETVYSYWSDGSQSFITPRGYYSDMKVYGIQSHSFRDFEGNTYFAGSTFKRKPRWGTIVATVVTLPLVLPTMLLLPAACTPKTTVSDLVILKQNSKGALSLYQTVKGNKVKMTAYSNLEQRRIYSVSNSFTKSEYLVINDVSDIFIYNVNQNKVVRTIPQKDGKIYTSVFPAKEGHIMISEYNKKEKYTRVSIEAL